MKWYKIKITTETEAVDILTYLLQEDGIEGAVIEDPNDPMFAEDFKGDWDYSEKQARTFETEDTIVKVFIEFDKDIDGEVNRINKMLKNIESNGLNIGKGNIEYEVVDDEEWKDKWKEYFKPFKIGSKLVVKPSWEEYIPASGEIIIEMDPGSAFGSGTHETTSMCVKLIEEVIEGQTVIDIGCGTGILGIAAGMLGSKKIIGVDISEDAIIATDENIIKNNLKGIMEVRLGNLIEVIEEKADLVVANIMADIIIGMVPDLENVININGKFIASGIIDEKREDVIKALEDNKFEVVTVLSEGGWNAILSKYIG